MADLSTGGNPRDERAALIKRRRLAYEANAMQTTVEKYEIDILEAEANIERLKESISATIEKIEGKREELKNLEGKDNG
jgi:uncharacterized protein YqgV (UPF0045/DUF77 family)